MKNLLAGLALATLLTASGCDKGTPGGSVKDKDKDKDSTVRKLKDKVSQADDTFTLSVPSASLKQGESKAVTVTITRGKNFTEDVSLKFDGLPTGVTVDPAAPVLKKSETEASVTVKAATDAALGTSTVKVIGHPAKGPDDSTNEMKVTVEKK